MRLRIVLLLVPAIAPAAAQAPPGAAVLACTNPSSGATWRVRIDARGSTVDTYPARITEGAITWHDLADGGHYRLDRASGALTVVVASSTGGYFLHDRCRPVPSGG